MLDRLLHRSVVINLDGESCRLRDHHAAAETLRRTTTGTANHYTDRCSQVRNFGEHTWGVSMSAIRIPRRMAGDPPLSLRCLHG